MRAFAAAVALATAENLAVEDDTLLLQVQTRQHAFAKGDDDDDAAGPDPFVDMCEDFDETGKDSLTDEEKKAWGTDAKAQQFAKGKGSYTNRWMHGPWGNDWKVMERTWKLNPSTTKCTVKWTTFGQHSRDNEYDRVYIDGTKVWEQRMAGNKEYPKEFTVDCSDELTVKWTSDIDQHVNDEAWGFANVKIKQNDCVPTTTTLPAGPGACMPGRSCGTLKVICHDGIQWDVEASEVEKHGELKIDCSDGGAWVLRAAPQFTTEPPPICDGVLYDETEAGAIGEGWSDTTVGQGRNERTDIAKMHGPWGNNVKEVKRDWEVLGGNKCKVTWTSYGMHTRDNEWDRLYINGDKVWEKQMRGGTVQNNVWEGDCDKGDGKLSIRYTSDIDQHINDESWGFNNFKIIQEGCDAAAA